MPTTPSDSQGVPPQSASLFSPSRDDCAKSYDAVIKLIQLTSTEIYSRSAGMLVVHGLLLKTVLDNVVGRHFIVIAASTIGLCFAVFWWLMLEHGFNTQASLRRLGEDLEDLLFGAGSRIAPLHLFGANGRKSYTRRVFRGAVVILILVYVLGATVAVSQALSERRLRVSGLTRGCTGRPGNS